MPVFAGVIVAMSIRVVMVVVVVVEMSMRLIGMGLWGRCRAHEWISVESRRGER